MRDPNETLRKILKGRDEEFDKLQDKLEQLQEKFRKTTETEGRLHLSRQIEKLDDEVNVRLSLARSA